jgi:hypothetical protein
MGVGVVGHIRHRAAVKILELRLKLARVDELEAQITEMTLKVNEVIQKATEAGDLK